MGRRSLSQAPHMQPVGRSARRRDQPWLKSTPRGEVEAATRATTPGSLRLPGRMAANDPDPLHWAVIVFTRSDFNIEVPYSDGSTVGQLKDNLARRNGVTNAQLATSRDFRPSTVLSLADPVPVGAVLYLRPRCPPVAPLEGVSLYVEMDNQTGCTVVLVPVYKPLAELDALIAAISGTGAKPDFWLVASAASRGWQAVPHAPRRLRRSVPLCLQVARVAGATITWTFAAERQQNRCQPQWRPGLVSRARPRDGDAPLLDLGAGFWAAQRDLAPEFFHRRSCSPRLPTAGESESALP